MAEDWCNQTTQIIRVSLVGMVLADATGLGKSLAALVAALEKRKQMLPYCGPVLVVTRPSCAHQWSDEMNTHFNKVSTSLTGHGTEFRLTTATRADLK